MSPANFRTATRLAWLCGLLLLAVTKSILADSDPLDRLQELEAELGSHKDELARFEQRANELVDLIRQSQQQRSEISERMRDSERSLATLREQQRQLESQVRALEKRLRETRTSGTRAAAWALSLSRGSRIEMLLSVQESSARLRNRGLLQAVLDRVEETANSLARDIAALADAKTELENNQATQVARKESLVRDRADIEAREKRLAESLDVVKKDTRITQQLIGDLEQARAELARIIASRGRRGGDLLSLETYKRQMRPPVEAQLLMDYGNQQDPVFGVQIEHPGWTYKIGKGTPVLAVAPAETVYAGWLRGYGNLVVLQHGDEYFTLYGYLDEVFVKQGDRIDRDAPIGLSGDSGSLYGPALHFEIRHRRDPLDPGEWLVGGR